MDRKTAAVVLKAVIISAFLLMLITTVFIFSGEAMPSSQMVSFYIRISFYFMMFSIISYFYFKELIYIWLAGFFGFIFSFIFIGLFVLSGPYAFKIIFNTVFFLS